MYHRPGVDVRGHGNLGVRRPSQRSIRIQTLKLGLNGFKNGETMDAKDVFSFILNKVTPPTLIFVIALALALLYTPNPILTKWGLLKTRDDNMALIGGAFLVSGVSLIVQVGFWISNCVLKKIKGIWRNHKMGKRLLVTTPLETGALLHLAYTGEHVCMANKNNPGMASLEQAGIVTRLPETMDSSTISFRIDPFARKFIAKHPERFIDEGNMNGFKNRKADWI